MSEYYSSLVLASLKWNKTEIKLFLASLKWKKKFIKHNLLLFISAAVNVLQTHVPHVMTFIEQIACDDEHSDTVLSAGCGLIG